MVCTRDELFDRIAAARAKAAQAVRYRLAMLERRLRQQGIDRALGILHRRIGRGLQQTDEHEYRMRERCAPPSRPANGRAAPWKRASASSTCAPAWPPTAAAWRPLTTPPCNSCARAWGATAAGSIELAAKLSQLSPLRVLERGYAIVSNQAGVVTDAAAAPPDSRIHVRLHRGALDAVVLPVE